MNRFFAGLSSGLIATVPMTLVMQTLHRWPHPEPEALPPLQITERVATQVAAQAGVQQPLDEPQLKALTLVNHFGFGGAMGGVYALISSQVAAHPVCKGAIWGLMVWTLSYLGWLPAAHILAPATEVPRRRNFLMILAHLVWGISTAMLTERLAAEKTSE